MNFFEHDAGHDEAQAVYDAIMAGHLTTGVKLGEFARALEARFGFPRVELCSSGTSAVHLVLHTLGVGPGDEVVTTPFSGVWAVNMILAVGATPVFADIDRDTYNLDLCSVISKTSDRTKAVMPVSVNGVPCDYHGLRSVLPRGVRLVCDDIEALGSQRHGVYVGADMQGGDISINGFWTSKQVTTCGGGMVTSDDLEFLGRFEKATRHGHGLVGNLWEQAFGFNSWLCDPMAAMGIVQVARFDEKQTQLRCVRDLMDARLGEYRKQRCAAGHSSSEFVYLIELPDGVGKRDYADRMSSRGIPTRPYFNDLMEVPHLSKYKTPCPVAQYLAAKTIALPYHWRMTPLDVDIVADAHYKVLRECGALTVL